MSYARSKYPKPYTIASIEFLYNNTKLWLNPEYQRESVWTTPQKQLLVDSLLHKIDIPKLYFRDVNGNEDGYEFEVVDGQQRLRTILSYLKDDYRLGSSSDDVEGEIIAGKLFSELSTSLQIEFKSESLDVIVLQHYSDDDVEEMFLRLQNGTPLNAAEKRRAIKGNVRTIVKDLSGNKIFSLVGYTDKRYAYEDTTAKLLHEILAPGLTDIKPATLERMYRSNEGLKETDKKVQITKSSLNFLYRAFKGKAPNFKKYAIISLGHLTSEMLEVYDLSSYPDEFAEAYIEFEYNRIKNNDLDEAEQSAGLIAFTNAARADDIPSLRYRHDELLKVMIAGIPNLVKKDTTRLFSDDQRMAIFRRDKGVCTECSKTCDETDFHADHVIAWSKGGPTSLANGTVLCPECNLKKSSK